MRGRGNRKWNEAANTLFDDWAERADFTGRFDFWDLQRLSSFYLDTDGEVFALWTDEGGLPQIQMLESWRIDKPTAADDRIFDGVQLDTQGGSRLSSYSSVSRKPSWLSIGWPTRAAIWREIIA